MPQANILDPIHDALDPLVWEDPETERPHLRPVHREWIRRTVRTILEDNGYQDIDKWLTLVFTGSLTTYQYSDESDVDISLFVDVEQFPEWKRGEMIGVMVKHMDGTNLPGTPHPMQCFVVPPQIKVHDLYQLGLRSGYDLQTDEWIVPPERDRAHDVQNEENGYYAYALECADKMDSLLKYEPDKAVMFWHQIHNRRRRDQQLGKGDFSEANIAYKMLANRGLFPKIADVSGEYIAKKSMAERSGFPELDAAIEEFMRLHPEVEELRNPQNAWGRCEEVAQECAEFLKQRGFKAYAPADEIGAFPGYEKAQDSAEIGAGEFSYPEHAMVEVYGLYGPNNVNNVTIDFTASQYGFTEFPKVEGGKVSRTAAQPDVAKYVYNPHTNQIAVGEMAREEGETLNHMQLVQHIQPAPEHARDLQFGQVRQNGYVQTFPRSNIVGIGQGQMNQYEAMYKAQQAVQHAIPGAKFTNPVDALNKAWNIDPPEVRYTGQPPRLNWPEDDGRQPEEEQPLVDWNDIPDDMEEYG